MRIQRTTIIRGVKTVLKKIKKLLKTMNVLIVKVT
jgi:hypothetical protein